MANPESSNNKQDFPKFCGADEATIRRLVQKLNEYLKCDYIVQTFGPNCADNLYADTNTLFEMLNRVEMRRIYFHVCHNSMDMGELNEGCLLCFWILKLMPFQHAVLSARITNVKIALCLFLNMLTYVASRQNKIVNKSSELISKLAYAFQYRDLSKEALMMIAEVFLRTA